MVLSWKSNNQTKSHFVKKSEIFCCELNFWKRKNLRKHRVYAGFGADSRTRTDDQGLSIKRRHIVFWFFVCNRCICTVMPPWIIHSPCRVFRQICNKSQSAEMFFRPQLVLCDEQQFCLSAHLVLRHPTCRLWCIFYNVNKVIRTIWLSFQLVNFRFENR